MTHRGCDMKLFRAQSKPYRPTGSASDRWNKAECDLRRQIEELVEDVESLSRAGVSAADPADTSEILSQPVVIYGLGCVSSNYWPSEGQSSWGTVNAAQKRLNRCRQELAQHLHDRPGDDIIGP